MTKTQIIMFFFCMFQFWWLLASYIYSLTFYFRLNHKKNDIEEFLAFTT